jgi:hypothetical protein
MSEQGATRSIPKSRTGSSVMTYKQNGELIAICHKTSKKSFDPKVPFGETRLALLPQTLANHFTCCAWGSREAAV